MGEEREGYVDIVNCLFVANEAQSTAGGFLTPKAEANVINSTFTGNAAPGVGGIDGSDGGALSVRNSILWDNGGSTLSDQLATPATFSLNYSCVQGLTPGQFGGVGNIATDPSFADAGSGNYRLSAGSPCINGGDPDQSVIPDDVFDLDQDGVTTGQKTPDLDLTARVADDVVDMGPYESGNCATDINNDGVVNVTDLISVLGGWGACPGPPDPCPGDTNDDGVVDVIDLVAVILTWGTKCAVDQNPPQSIAECVNKIGDDPIAIFSCIQASGYFD